MKFRELTPSEIFIIHEVIVSEYHISNGCDSKGSVSALLEKIEFLKYNDVYKRAAVLLEGLIRLHPFVDGNKRTALQSVKQYLNLNKHVLIFPLSTVSFTYKIASNTKNTPEENENIILEIYNWIKIFSAPLDSKGKAKTIVIIRVYYEIPIICVRICNKIHFKKLGNFILKKYLGMNKNNLNEDMFNFIMDLLKKQLEKVDNIK